jgi:predicted Rossmann fold flavoprotein
MDKSLYLLSKKIAIIGGGAAGLIAAITASENSHQVTIFEKSDKLGKKILASGNGRCNISNTSLHVSDYFTQNSYFIDRVLKQFSFDDFKKFCDSIGLFLDIKEDGRVYPLSNEAKSVQLLLQERALALHVKVKYNHHIDKIEKKDDKFIITDRDTKQVYKEFDSVIITTGSEAALQLGGSDEGYRLAQSFGHDIVTSYPSLVQLHLNSDIHSKMAGVKLSGEVTLFVDRQKCDSISGDLLFTKYGISGFAILDISQEASLALTNYQQVSISLNLLPQFDINRLKTKLTELSIKLSKQSIEHLLIGLISSKIVPYILLTCKLNPKTLCADITAKDIKKIIFTLTQWRFEVSDTHGFKHAEVSGGGISTQKIDAKTMHSNIVNGLYFAGEVLDVLGKRGGYNLHFAWASGYIAAKNIY